MSTIKKAFVISGGDNRGPYLFGATEALQMPLTGYDLYVGVSFGGLPIPFMALDKIEYFETMMYTIGNKGVWKYKPTTKKGKISIPKALFHRLFLSNKAIGDTGNLLKTIRTHYTREMHNEIQKPHRAEVVVATYNISLGLTQYWSAKHLPWEAFTKMMYATTAIPFLTPPIKFMGHYHVDAGVREHTPLSYAVQRGSENTDVFVLRQSTVYNTDSPLRTGDKAVRSLNMEKLASLVFQDTRQEIELRDIDDGIEKAIDAGKRVRIFDMKSKHEHPQGNYDSEGLLSTRLRGYNDYKHGNDSY